MKKKGVRYLCTQTGRPCDERGCSRSGDGKCPLKLGTQEEKREVPDMGPVRTSAAGTPRRAP